jgi:hypothetical protein
MERRKLLISIGALGTGGAAAFGTEAFTSIEAERNVDVNVAGDSSAYLAFEALDSVNGNDYVTTESDGTLSITLDGSGGAAGSGVNQDAVTQIEDLFKVVNQGTQSASVYFEDDSDAVTFRVTRSTDTSTNGSNGQSLEGADNAVELDVGEQVVVGMTIDTLNNDVSSGGLLDAVTVVADADASAPGQSTPAPQYVVNGEGDQPNTFATLSDALADSDISAGSVIGIEGNATITESSKIDVATDDLTITGFDGRPTIERDVQDDAFITASGDGVTIRNLTITEDVSPAGAGGERSLLATGTGVTFDGVRVENTGTVKGNPGIVTTGADTTITNCEAINNPIGANGATGSLTLTNNYIEDALDEGIFTYNSSAGSLDLTVRNNDVANHDVAGNGVRELKFVDDPASLNGYTDADAQFRSLLAENDVNTVELTGNQGVTVDKDGTAGNVYGDIQTGLSEAGQDGYVRVNDGTYGGFQLGNGATVESEPGSRPVIDASEGVAQSGRIVNADSDGPTIRGFEIVGEGTSLSDRVGVTIPGQNGVVEDIVVRNVLTGVQFSTDSANNVARFVTAKNAQVGVSTAGGTGHAVDSCDFTALIRNDYDNAPEGIGVAGDTEATNNNFGEDVFLRIYDSGVTVTSNGDFFGANGEDGEVVGETSAITVSNVVTSPNADAGAK